MESHAPPLRQNRFSFLPARPWVSRLIATVGIVVMMVGLDVPVAGRVLHIGGGSLVDTSWTIRNWVYGALANTTALMSGPVEFILGFEAVYSVLTWGGLALIPLLWRSRSPKGTVAFRWTYAIWMALLTLLAVGGCPHCTSSCRSHPETCYRPRSRSPWKGHISCPTRSSFRLVCC